MQHLMTSKTLSYDCWIGTNARTWSFPLTLIAAAMSLPSAGGMILAYNDTIIRLWELESHQ